MSKSLFLATLLLLMTFITVSRSKTYVLSPVNQSGCAYVAEVIADEGQLYWCCNGECVKAIKTTTNKICAQSKACTEDGECAAVNGKCKPSKVEHCEGSRACKVYDMCLLSDGKW